MDDALVDATHRFRHGGSVPPVSLHSLSATAALSSNWDPGSAAYHDRLYEIQSPRTTSGSIPSPSSPLSSDWRHLTEPTLELCSSPLASPSSPLHSSHPPECTLTFSSSFNQLWSSEGHHPHPTELDVLRAPSAVLGNTCRTFHTTPPTFSTKQATSPLRCCQAASVAVQSSTKHAVHPTSHVMGTADQTGCAGWLSSLTTANSHLPVRHCFNGMAKSAVTVPTLNDTPSSSILSASFSNDKFNVGPHVYEHASRVGDSTASPRSPQAFVATCFEDVAEYGDVASSLTQLNSSHGCTYDVGTHGLVDMTTSSSSPAWVHSSPPPSNCFPRVSPQTPSGWSRIAAVGTYTDLDGISRTSSSLTSPHEFTSTPHPRNPGSGSQASHYMLYVDTPDVSLAALAGHLSDHSILTPTPTAFVPTVAHCSPSPPSGGYEPALQKHMLVNCSQLAGAHVRAGMTDMGRADASTLELVHTCVGRADASTLELVHTCVGRADASTPELVHTCVDARNRSSPVAAVQQLQSAASNGLTISTGSPLSTAVVARGKEEDDLSAPAAEQGPIGSRSAAAQHGQGTGPKQVPVVPFANDLWLTALPILMHHSSWLAKQRRHLSLVCKGSELLWPVEKVRVCWWDSPSISMFLSRHPLLLHVELHGCALSRELLSCLSLLPCLQHLSLQHCAQLDAVGWRSVRSMTGLKTLHLEQCEGVCAVLLDGLEGLTLLEQLLLCECQGVDAQALYHISCLPSLTHLSLRGCNGVTAEGTQHLAAGLTSLTHLDLSSCWGVGPEALQPLTTLSRLQHLILTKCHRVKAEGLLHLGCITSLTHLVLEWCYEVDDTGLVNLSALTNLSSLNLGGCMHVDRGAMAHIAQLAGSLRSLELVRCIQVDAAALEHVACLIRLQRLDLGWCQGVSSLGLQQLTHLTSLTHLNLASCEGLDAEGLGHVGQLTLLEYLDLSECFEVDAEGLSHLSSIGRLSHLDVSECNRVDAEGLRCIGGMQGLRYLGLNWCAGVNSTGLQQILGLKGLRYLGLGGCEVGAAELSKLGALTCLEHLELCSCDAVDTDVLKSLSCLEELRKLDLRGCKGVDAAVGRMLQVWLGCEVLV